MLKVKKIKVPLYLSDSSANSAISGAGANDRVVAAEIL